MIFMLLLTLIYWFGLSVTGVLIIFLNGENSLRQSTVCFIFLRYFLHTILIFFEICLKKGYTIKGTILLRCLMFSSNTFLKSFFKCKSNPLVCFFSLRFHGCICCKLVINYGYDLFALLMWVICIKEYLYQNDQKPKNYSRLINDNVTCWSNKKILSNGKFKPSSLVWTNQILRCLKYDKYIHHIIIYHYVYGKRKKIQCM